MVGNSFHCEVVAWLCAQLVVRVGLLAEVPLIRDMRRRCPAQEVPPGPPRPGEADPGSLPTTRGA
eukprot:5868548-Lingulodinium_polyedra.AAC.1